MFFNIKKVIVTFSGILAIAALTACSPEVGSKEWCEDLKEKPKGDWSSNEAADFAKNCVF
ncbi:MAG: DUF3012 domain-containing protein [Rhodospirillaceae bacterium]|jgi:hypothetical protein|nr:DUF3012 domain-containing protein [Rhodospirillaceae bacterium]MBT5244014.1 DUF3012 domain-containing protein [Rhodospirillaceae bacterium]MBT5560834.1 DUF3012 domain-containing protein [Rhodospirillaceae bacterium]MBT6240572.1 DUF3012 domain-containing protein [Rhodospirillaceae bacterium]MBT7138358.1 DUF3012 domain-containing protein [Rhodospirillaceae bacterium]